jgi:hypothetical protein
MAYTTINKSTDFFNTLLYTATGTQSVTGAGFQPDMSWVKARSTTSSHYIADAVRGSTKTISTNNTNAEGTQNLITSFDSDGVSLGSSNWSDSRTAVIWNWKANGTGSANTDGSINSTVSVNATAGFSIATWTTPSSGTQFTIGHGLGQAPGMMIMKCTTQSNSWFTYHKGLGGNVNDYLVLNETTAEASQTNMWGANGAETNTMGLKAGTSSYTNEPMIGYFFAEKQGYSKIGSYTGNGNADGSFIYTGFKPQFILIKNKDSGTSWCMFDTKRQPGNDDTAQVLHPNLINAEDTGNFFFDILSNGFKVRTTSSTVNGSGNTMIYLAIGQSLVGDNNIPCTAR